MAGVEFKKGYKRGFRAGEESVDEGLPGWFGTFADMMTLLFAFFVLLAAISTMDPVKLQEMANSTGKSLGSKIKKENAAELEGEYEKLTTLVDVKKALEESIKELEEAMKEEGKDGDPPMDITTSPKGVTINIKGDYAFPSGKAEMKPELKTLLTEEITPKIMASPFIIEVAGHSDSDPMPKKWQNNYASNWELSAARGAAVVRELITQKVPAKRLIAAGFGDWSPRGLDTLFMDPTKLTWETVLKYNSTVEEKRANRRIQVTFLKPSHHSAKDYAD
jgi:chemotaxis protein MotB